jgi:hypothetical protein
MGISRRKQKLVPGLFLFHWHETKQRKEERKWKDVPAKTVQMFS